MPTILVIDDDREYNRFLDRYLSMLGFSAFPVTTGDLALEFSKTIAPDLILLDWCLKDGITAEETLRCFRSRPETKTVPVVVISGIKDGPEDEARARRAGAALFFTKNELSDTVKDREVFRRHLTALIVGRETDSSPGTQAGLRKLLTQVQSVGRILVIDDEASVRELLSEFFREKGYTTLHADTGASGLRKAQQEFPDLIVLDLGLPDMDGLDVCAQLKSNPRTRTIPVLILTGRTSKQTELLTLEYRADYCLPKPIPDWDHFHDWIAALLRRRSHTEPNKDIIRIGDLLTIDMASRTVALPGRTIANLPPSLFRLLCEFARHPGETLSHEYLLTKVWVGPMGSQSPKGAVKRLRDCLGAPFADWLISVRGTGFRFEPGTRGRS